MEARCRWSYRRFYGKIVRMSYINTRQDTTLIKTTKQKISKIILEVLCHMEELDFDFERRSRDGHQYNH